MGYLRDAREGSLDATSRRHGPWRDDPLSAIYAPLYLDLRAATGLRFRRAWIWNPLVRIETD